MRITEPSVMKFLGIAAGLCCAVAASDCMGEVAILQHADGQDGLTVYKMTVTPAAEPVPALKHRLTIRPHKRRPGNGVTHYLRSAWENGIDSSWEYQRKKIGEDEFDAWIRPQDVPIEDLPLERVESVVRSFSSQIDAFIDPATRSRRYEWGLGEEDLRGTESIAFLLPDTQGMRTLSRVLTLATRFAIAEHRYDDAINYARMNYKLGQDVGSQKFLVSNLVGIAVVGMGNQTMIDLIAAPDSPNMYWALSELPRPIVSIRESIRLEMSLGPRMFPVLLDVEEREHSPEEWARLLNEVFVESRGLGDFFNGSLLEDSLTWDMAITGIAIVAYPAAKERLIQSGMEPAEVDAMPVAQVMLIDMAREWQRIADEYEKWHYVDYPQSIGRMDRADRELYEDNLAGGFGNLLARLLLPAVSAARRAEVRVGWELDALRVIEAIRMHAAETGELPRRLDQIQVVPVPINPITRNEFVYRTQNGGKTGVLELPFSDGMPGRAHRFEITLAE